MPTFAAPMPPKACDALRAPLAAGPVTTPLAFSAVPAGAVNAAGRPTKLFIGGISRHTTTKFLRDHFSQHGRVLDCVAMRQPDGRSRGFGYVTLDSPAAGERCLAEPQVIDGRVVDMKLAVPEGASAAKVGAVPMSPHHNPNMDAASMMGFGASDYHFPYGFQDTLGQMGGAVSPLNSPWWAGLNYGAASARGALPGARLDCLELLRTTPSPSGISAGRTFVREEVTTPLTTPKSMSAFAAEFVPFARDREAAPTPAAVKAVLATIPQAAPAVRVRTPLGDMTNVAANFGNMKDAFAEMKKPQAMGMGRMKPAFIIAVDEEEDIFEDEADDNCSTPGSSEDGGTYGSPASPATQSDDKAYVAAAQAAAALCTCDLPSIGSAMHASGECRRCNFFPKGRCQNGKDCIFCHLPHEKRKPSRQEKRERKAAWQSQNTQHQEEYCCAEKSSPFLGLPPLIVSSDSLSTGLPTPSSGAVMSPPGLGAPMLDAAAMFAAWQPEEEAANSLLSPFAGIFARDSPTCFLPPVLATSPTSSVLATQPPSAATYSLATPNNTAWSPATVAEAAPSVACKPRDGNAVFSTQPMAAEEVAAQENRCGCMWSREEMLRLRGAMESKSDEASEEQAELGHRPVWRSAVVDEAK